MSTHDVSVREAALALLRSGLPNGEVARRLCVPAGTVGWWRHEDRRRRGEPLPGTMDCPICTKVPFDHCAYAYLLGLYLGDGHIVSKCRQHHLSISCNASQPGLIDAAEGAMRKVMPRPGTGRRLREGCVEVKSYTRHWTCMFPQHGPGKKHERSIVLEEWQQAIVDAHPWEFVRGLIHSDGCRTTNWTNRLVGGERKRYEYPRYMFANKSDDIRKLLTDTLTRLGVQWTVLARDGAPFNVSIARKESVALMDLHVGPKH
ncbi:helix-turn-helix domain-containing protein [Streptomyces sp. enrichment culture]|uniref:helix-turn-helix domain-containing protein n=1 Tax=Streptomyces sp. enrichment culture TaxID=1795815 RepID=UPI003F570B72